MLADVDPRLDDLQDLDMTTRPPVNPYHQLFRTFSLDRHDDGKLFAPRCIFNHRLHLILSFFSLQHADDESDDNAMECFVSSTVDDHVSAMMSSGIGVAVRESERQLRLELRGAMWDMARQVKIAFSSF